MGNLKEILDCRTPIQGVHIKDRFRTYLERAIKHSMVQGSKCAETLVLDFMKSDKKTSP